MKQRNTFNPSTSTLSNQKISAFYKTKQIRYRSLGTTPYISKRKAQIRINNNPWRELTHKQIQQVVERLQDKPEDLYEIVKKQKNVMRHKFTLLNLNKPESSNAEMIRKLNEKKKRYEEEFRSIFKSKQTSSLQTNLPKLEKVKSLFGDKLHLLKKTVTHLRI